MRVSCCAYSYRQLLQGGKMTMEEFIETVRELGLDGAELTSYYFPTTERAYLNRLKKLAHDKGVLVSGTAVGSDFAQPDADKRRQHVQMTKDWIHQSVVLGAPTLRVFAGPVREGCSVDQAFSWCVECLQECAEVAEQNGVLLALENHGGLTGDAAGTLKLLDAVNSEWLGSNLDFGNFTDDAYNQFAICAPRAVATHAKVTMQTPHGRAKVDYEKVKQIMDGTAYRGFLAIEYEEEEDPVVGVPAFAKELLEVYG